MYTLTDVVRMAESTPVVDCHTHIQDDLPDFTAEVARGNLVGTQAPFNRFPDSVVEASVRQRCLVRRTMADATHSLFYSWFAEVAEGSAGGLDQAIRLVGSNSEAERRASGRHLVEQLRDSRHSEYAEWLRYMFRLYPGLPADVDPLDPAHFDCVYEAVRNGRNDPDLARRILADHGVQAYVTSIENRADAPPPPVAIDRVDLGYRHHPEAWCMFDMNYLVWPAGATDFGLFTQGHKSEAERFLLNLEQFYGRGFTTARDLRDATVEFIRRIVRSPDVNPASRVLYVDGFLAPDFRFSTPYCEATVNHALRHCRTQLNGDNLRQVVACVAEGLLVALDEVGAVYRRHGERYGCCLQLAAGVTYFMDPAREIQSFPVYIPRLAQDEYAVWTRYPNVHFEYICAHRQLYEDMANAAKQVPNVSVGPWWHFFRRHQIAHMLYDQLSMGPVSAIACGFTDARFVEMLAAKYRSVRWAVAMALERLLNDPFSSLHNKPEAARDLLETLLRRNPEAVHHLPASKPA